MALMGMNGRCLLCTNELVEDHVSGRLARGASFDTIAKALGDKGLKKAMSYARAPSATSLSKHMVEHRVALMKSAQKVGAVGPADASSGDVAKTIQTKGLEMLEDGTVKLNAGHLLRAQEMLDRRLERQANRELAMLLSRMLTRDSAPPEEMIVVQGEAVAVEG